jgi:hypothetical protein
LKENTRLFKISSMVHNSRTLALPKLICFLLQLERGGSSAPMVKPEAATAVVELLMMGVRMPETC